MRLCFDGGLNIAAYSGAANGLLRGQNVTPTEYAGSAAGAIIAGALACGATREFIKQELTVDITPLCLPGVMAGFNCQNYMGSRSGDSFTKWYARVIHKLTGCADITLQNIHEIYGGRLIIAGTNISARENVYFDYIDYPELSLILAVRISMGLPFIFSPVQMGGCMWINNFASFPNDEDTIRFTTTGCVNDFWSLYGAIAEMNMEAAIKIPTTDAYQAGLEIAEGLNVVEPESQFRSSPPMDIPMRIF